MDNCMDKYLGQMLDGRYEILEIIGSGGMAVVYKALCHRLNRYVAIKILRDDMAMDAEYRRRFRTEATAVGMLSDPNIVSVYDFSRSGNPEYIVMELVEGVTLKQYMLSKGALNWQETLHFSMQIGRALSHAHKRGIVHRDIKPHNIMLTHEGIIKVTDFGIARLQNTQNTIMNQEALGSVHYISPEQAKGEPVDHRSDLYSLGVVMYEMLTGRLPFEGDNAVAVAVQHINTTPPQPHTLNPEIPAELEAITMKAMNPDISRRYQSADAFLADLDAFKNGRRTQAALELEKNTEEDYMRAAPIDEEEFDVDVQNVKPISRSGELSKSAYKQRKRSSQKVSTLFGFLIVLVFLIAVFSFLWSYWLKDIFSEASRVIIPSFVESNVNDIINDPELTDIYNFTIVYQPDIKYDKDIITAQDPESGKSLMLVSEGIPITLTVSSGIQMENVEDVTNQDYRAAKQALEAQGFLVEIQTVEDSSVTKDYVISTDPAVGSSLAVGSTVTMVVSGGPSIVQVKMENLVGKSQSAAQQWLESNNLVLGGVTPVPNTQYGYGMVVWQSAEPGTAVEEHTKIYIQVSSGGNTVSANTEG